MALIIEGYASLFDVEDRGGDTVRRGAFADGLLRLAAAGGRVRMLWQHDPAEVIGVWEDIREDDRGLRCVGRLLSCVPRGREVAGLVHSGAVDGLSIGYRVDRAELVGEAKRNLLEISLMEVSVVTFALLEGARIDAFKGP